MAYNQKKPNPSHFKKGDPRLNTKGRPPGAQDKFSIAQAKAAAKSGLTPLEFLLKLMRADPEDLKLIGVPLKDVDTAMRKRAADSAAPYVHRKMPIGIDNGAGGPVGSYTAEQLALLSNTELDALSKIMGRIAVLAPQPEEKT